VASRIGKLPKDVEMKKELSAALIMCSVMLSAPAVGTDREELVPIPENRIFYQQVSGSPVELETYKVTSECRIGLWIDEKLAFVINKGERSSFKLEEGRHNLRLSYEPLPKEPQNEEEKKRHKYCYKEKPQKLGYNQEIEVKDGQKYLLYVRANKGNLFRFRFYEDAREKSDKYPFY